MSKQQDGLKQKSSAKTEISGAVADQDLDRVTGGDKAAPKRGKDEGPRESITFAFGRPAVKYNEQ
jgi:hypothetical protein